MKNPEEKMKRARKNSEEKEGLPQKLFEEEVLSSEKLAEQGRKEIKKFQEAAGQIKEKGEARVEKIAENIGMYPELVEKVKKEMGFEGKKEIIFGKIKTSVSEINERVKDLFGSIDVVKLSEKDIELIEEREPFAPAEEYKKTQKIVESGASVAEKESALHEYRKKLMEQKEETAQLQNNFRKIIEKNPDISAEDLMEKMEPYMISSRLAEKQKEIFKELATVYQKKHHEIKSIREKYPDDKELFKACFGFVPKGKIKVAQDPVSFYFKCANPDDFVGIYRQKNIPISKEMEEDIKKTARGVTPHFSKIESIKKNVALENSSIGTDETRDETHKHEKQHIFYDFFRENEVKINIRKGLAEKEWSAGEKERAILTFLRNLREDLLNTMTKDEILANFINNVSFANIKTRLMNKSYHISNVFEKQIENKIKKTRLQEIVGEELLEEMKDAVFQEEYEDIVDRGLKSLFDLKKSDMSNDKIIELLTPEPLEQWPNLVRHLKQVEKSR
jgi:hypothetical protein